MANFERLKHCEDNQVLNGVVFFYNLQVFLKFSSLEVLALSDALICLFVRCNAISF